MYVFGNVNLTRSPIASWMCIHGIQYEKVVMYLFHIRLSLTWTVRIRTHHSLVGQ
jgi:hypothetical protein